MLKRSERRTRKSGIVDSPTGRRYRNRQHWLQGIEVLWQAAFDFVVSRAAPVAQLGTRHHLFVVDFPLDGRIGTDLIIRRPADPCLPGGRALNLPSQCTPDFPAPA